MSSVHHETLRPIALELRHFRLVLAIHEHGGVTRAGEQLNLTQSALSHQLSEIEERLGVKLFHRTNKRLTLTDAGQRVLDVARQVLGDVVSLEDELRDHAGDRRGTIRIATECYTCYDWLPPLLKRFTRKHPNVAVQIVADATSHPVEALESGAIDVAIVTRQREHEGIRLHPLFEDEMLLVTATDHPLAKKRYVRPHDLRNETLLLYSPRATSRFYAQFFGGTTAEPREVVQVQLTEAMLSMIRAGLGVGALARWAIAGELRRRSIAGVQLGPTGLHRAWQAATRANERMPRYLADFIDLIAAEAAPTRFEAA